MRVSDYENGNLINNGNFLDKYPEEEGPMTVCIASLSKEGYIVGASDRMVTYDGLTFEPPLAKIWLVTSSIVIMTSGDSALQAETLNLLQKHIDNRTTSWSPVTVREVGEIYVKCRNAIISYRSENAVLSKFGLTHQSFLSIQKTLSFEFVDEIRREISNYKAPATSTIITGWDGNSRLYTIHGNEINDCMKIGYATIGSGGRHAKLQLMLSQHSWISPFSKTLLLTYIAKKRSEISTGVGRETDMFVMAPHFNQLNENDLNVLQSEYKKISQKESNALKKSLSNIETHIDKLIEESNTHKSAIK